MERDILPALHLPRTLRKFGSHSMKLLFWILIQVFLSRVNSFNLDSRRHSLLMPEEQSKFFGYNFVFNASESSKQTFTRFLVGSPKAVPSSISESNERLRASGIDFYRHTTPGEVHACNYNFSSEITYCPASRTLNNEVSSIGNGDGIQDEQIALTDSLGLTLTAQANDVTVCSPLRIQNCSSHLFLHGLCQISNDFGRSWAPSRRGISRICPVDHLDLIFLLDGSGSVTTENFERVKNWVKIVTRRFDLQHFAQVGVVQYSHWYPEVPLTAQRYLETEVEIGQFRTHQDFNTAVDEIKYHSFTTYTAAAIRYATLEFMNSTRFNHSATEKILLLLTDGRSSDSAQLSDASDRARELGISIIAVGVSNYSRAELLEITGNEDKVFGLSDFTQLNQIVDELQRSIINSLEGDTNTNRTNSLQQAQSGLDAEFSRGWLSTINEIYLNNGIGNIGVTAKKWTKVPQQANFKISVNMLIERTRRNVLNTGERRSGSK